MIGTLVYYTRTDGGWGGKFRLQLLMTDGGSPSFHRSYLTRPSDLCVFGDKEVRHRKMSGIVEPDLRSQLPYPWTESDTYRWKYSVDVTMERSGGSTEAYAYGYSHGKGYFGYEEQHVQYKLVLEQDPDKAYRTNIVELRKLWNYKDPEPPWGRSILGYYDYGNIHNVVVIKTLKVNNDFEYDLKSPLPWYWIEYMDSIRPSSEEDYTVLSELIRNEIQEKTSFDTNNYANLISVIDSINDFRKGKLFDLVEDSKEYYSLVKNTFGRHFNGRQARTLMNKTQKGIASGWLKYRYVYNTTKSDVDQYVEAKLGEYLGTVSEDRVFRTSGSITNGTVHIKFRIHDDQSPNFDKLLISMNQYGFFPGLYNIWDLIPWSFTADWGSNLGDYLQDIDQSIFFRYYQIDELLVSRKQVLEKDEPWGSTTYTWYDRELWNDWPQWELYDDHTSSGKTIFCRGLDSLALVSGIFT